MQSSLHYFNPGHETAVLNTSKYYQPAVRQVNMQQELAFLPAWYARPEDFVLVENPLTAEFKLELKSLKSLAQAITVTDLNGLPDERVDLWGISPQSIHFFEKLNERYHLQLQIPRWKGEFCFLGSRFASQMILSQLMEKIPEIEKEILPRFFSNLNEIEQFVAGSNEKQLVKSPYSSSGRGLVWLPPGELARSERQIIGGMLKKQSQVSIEKALDKQLDFSMHCENTPEGQTRFIGYSVFQTNRKGAYEKSRLAAPEIVEEQITAFIDKELLLRVKDECLNNLQKMYGPYYTGNIGVDMLVYSSGKPYKLNPCVEINLRKSMGYLAIQLQKNYIYPQSQGDFFMDYRPTPGEIYRKHRKWKEQYPLVVENGRLKSGYLSLCPVTETSHYHAYLLVNAQTV
ncbi:MAG: hypothetical protein LBO74_00395 [Candidatus Symbiothrix sp.]|jgi:hypothetical protein|nr:hypothetical protein [Candidatus Symbiothrix sp.]